MTAPQEPTTPCPHGDDEGHAGLGRGWCDAGREGADRLQERARRVAEYLAARPSVERTDPR